MIIFCAKKDKCKNYERGKEGCWMDSTKGKIIDCSDYVEEKK